CMARAATSRFVDDWAQVVERSEVERSETPRTTAGTVGEPAEGCSRRRQAVHGEVSRRPDQPPASAHGTRGRICLSPATGPGRIMSGSPVVPCRGSATSLLALAAPPGLRRLPLPFPREACGQPRSFTKSVTFFAALRSQKIEGDSMRADHHPDSEELLERAA